MKSNVGNIPRNEREWIKPKNRIKIYHKSFRNWGEWESKGNQSELICEIRYPFCCLCQVETKKKKENWATINPGASTAPTTSANVQNQG